MLVLVVMLTLSLLVAVAILIVLVTEEPAHNVDSEKPSVPPKVTSLVSRVRFDVFRLQT